MKKNLVLLIVSLLSGVASAAAAQAEDGVYFSPRGGVAAALVAAIADSQDTIDVEMYYFTSVPLGDALIAAAARGVRVRVVLDEGQLGHPYAQGPRLADAGAAVRYEHSRGLLHPKLAIFDGARAALGSYNWTRRAEEENVEVLMFVDEPEYITAFRQHFAAVWASAKAAAEATGTAAAATPGEGPAGNFVPSRRSSRFHYPGCIYAKKIKEENRVVYETREAAVADGKKPCYYCSP